jgi:hypothetical protein
VRRVVSAIWSAVRGIGLGVAESYWLGFRTLLVAPAFVAVSAMPELLQHAVEIENGMFESREAARAFADSALRWNFGYGKIAGLILAILLVARLWAKGGSVRDALRIRLPVLIKVIVIFAVMTLGVGFVSTRLGALWPAGELAISILSNFAQAGIAVWMVGVLTEDPAASLQRAFTVQLPTALVMLILLGCAAGPAQLLHGLDHRLALGQPQTLVWLLMAFDSLLVGMMAALMGAALAVAYRMGATWRGWAPSPQTPPAPHPRTP